MRRQMELRQLRAFAAVLEEGGITRAARALGLSQSTVSEAIAALPMEPLLARVVSAHVMGGCAMSPTEDGGVTRPDCRLHRIEAVSVHDGSVFPTSIGANPQLSIYGTVGRMAAGLAQRLTGRPPAPLA